MKRLSNFRTRLFLGFLLCGLGCFAGLAWIAAYVHIEVMELVMLLYFLGIALTVIGAIGLLVIALTPLFKK